MKTKASCITGSRNISLSAVESNNQVVLIIHDSQMAGVFVNEFERTWTGGTELNPDDFDCAAE
jgi:phosphatidylserine/phosphatidylglycerophosphate/cardiolipin synthase-like enzyme